MCGMAVSSRNSCSERLHVVEHRSFETVFDAFLLVWHRSVGTGSVVWLSYGC